MRAASAWRATSRRGASSTRASTVPTPTTSPSRTSTRKTRPLTCGASSASRSGGGAIVPRTSITSVTVDARAGWQVTGFGAAGGASASSGGRRHADDSNSNMTASAPAGARAGLAPARDSTRVQIRALCIEQAKQIHAPRAISLFRHVSGLLHRGQNVGAQRAKGYEAQSGSELGMNLLMYAMTH